MRDFVQKLAQMMDISASQLRQDLNYLANLASRVTAIGEDLYQEIGKIIGLEYQYNMVKLVLVI